MKELPLIAECNLDLEGLRGQRNRYRELGSQATDVQREGDVLVVSFGQDLDRALLEETIVVERECCPFFSFDYSQAERTLTIGVSSREQRPALDALSYALGREGLPA
jgi:hypothetical protein